MYLRPSPVGSPDRGKWVIHMEGGGGCSSALTCVQRWCGDSYGASKMSSNFAPDDMQGRGIRAERADNEFADWNHVCVYYCSSDFWLGTRNDLILGYVGDHASGITDMRIEYYGYQIAVAAYRTLQARRCTRTWIRFWPKPNEDAIVNWDASLTMSSSFGMGLDDE